MSDKSMLFDIKNKYDIKPKIMNNDVENCLSDVQIFLVKTGMPNNVKSENLLNKNTIHYNSKKN
ncbi:MAG: hypothetical protein H6845_02090 [Alphaproteobacteria bacterium]|nr:MAG: hypothetical protein H6845_02090 [Alphaproteobacteria bacterium]